MTPYRWPLARLLIDIHLRIQTVSNSDRDTAARYIPLIGVALSLSVGERTGYAADVGRLDVPESAQLIRRSPQ
jgi:hypothetical protein